MAKKRTNYVRFGVRFPDGCFHSQTMNHECDEAHDAVKFGHFLVELGEEVIERATRRGACSAREAVTR